MQSHFVGPGGGGSFFQPTVSPVDSNRVLVASDMTGGYFSDNRGERWHSFNLRGPIRFFAFDYKNPRILYAKSIGLWCSKDAGTTWSLVYPDPKTVVRSEMHGDHAGQKLITKPEQQNMLALAVDPVDSKTLFAATGDRNSASFMISKDSGATWVFRGFLPGGTYRLVVDPMSRVGEREIYAIGKSSIAISHRWIWSNIGLPTGVNEVTDAVVGFSKGKSTNIYLIANGALYLSLDRGKSWSKANFTSQATVRAVASSIYYGNIAYASLRNLTEDGKTYLGVVRSNDGGATWKFVRKELETDRKPFGADWIGQFFGSGYADAPIALAVAPRHPMTVYSTDAGRILRSDDGGEHWNSVYSSRLPDGSFAGIGIEATNSHGVHFDPFDPKRIFISYTDVGLFRTENGGAGWLPSTDGVPHTWLNTTYWMTFDPAVRGRAWAVMSSVHDLPRAKIFARRSISSFKGGVVTTSDGGRTWVMSSDGMDPTAPTDIILDPDSPPETRVLYVAACGKGVYKSENAGRTWALKNNGITEKEPLAWRLVRDSSKGLYLIIVKRGEEPSPRSPDDGALYYSTDAAEHWIRVTLPAEVNAPNGIAVDPRNPDRLYLAAWGRFANGAEVGGGVYLSTNRAKTWTHVLTEDQHIFDVTVDERTPSVIYAVGFESSAWRSADAGLSWSRVPGYNFKWGQKVILDPNDPTKIYITTFGGGVWHGAAQSQTRTK
jgi:photosystem II stability/assembly factor-like uncharacterized protein